MNQILNEKNIRNYLENEPSQFKIFDIPYDKKTKKCLDNFKVERYNTYNNYGIDNLSGLNKFLNEIGSNTEEDINIMEKTIRDLTKLVMSSYNRKYTNYWLTIRSTLPNNNFDLKRWHCDLNFLEVKDINKRTDLNKFVTVLQGPGTFFLKTTSKERKLFYSMYGEESEKSKTRLKKDNSYLDDSSINDDIKFRKALTKKATGKIVQAKKYQAAIFMSFNTDSSMCGIHTEPPFNVPRLFLSITPCTKEEAKARRKYNKAVAKKSMTGGNIDYYLKYIKYKLKYLALKKQIF